MPTAIAPPVVPSTVKRIEIPYTAFPLTQAIHESQARIRVVCFGRRSGKSFMAGAEGFCMSRDAYQRGRRDIRGAIVAPTHDMFMLNWETFNRVFEQAITKRVVSESYVEIGPLGRIDFKSTEAQGGAGRGAGYDWLVLDEASQIPKNAWEADLRPTLADRRGRALIISTPQGLNWFYDLYQQALQDDPTFQSFHASTLDCWRSRCAREPEILRGYEEEWDLIRRTTSESKFREEYLAEFLASEGQTFSLKDRLWRGQLRGPVPGHHYVAGVDVARKEDFMVTIVIEIETQQLVGFARSRHQDWGLQKAVALHLLRQYPSAMMTYVESNGVGDPIAQDLRAAGINVWDVVVGAGRMKKGDLLENLLVGIDQCYLGIPQQAETQVLIEELKCYETTRQPSGAVKYGAPDGRHDDCVSALMLACEGLRGQWKMVEDAPTILAPWWEREDSFTERLAYDERVQQFQRRYPRRPLPVGPTDLAWTQLDRSN